MSTRIEDAARHHGLTLSYEDPAGDGPDRPVPEETLRKILEALGVDPDAPLEGPQSSPTMHVPESARCWLPPDLTVHPGWGVFCQLYELRSDRNWGIGDFADLATLAGIVGAAGADFLGINPVHALFIAEPDRRSPFYPSSRRFLNPLQIAPDLLPGVETPETVRDLRAAGLIDYSAVAKLKLTALRQAFDAEIRSDGIDAFLEAEGDALRTHAIFEAISSRMIEDGYGAGWINWPEALRDPRGDRVELLAEELADEVRFHVWLQMIAREQLRAASHAAREAGMRIGLYLDLAVGEAPDGSAAWSNPTLAMPGLTVGAPPDMFSDEGQNWALAAPSPVGLKKADLEPFRSMIDANLRDAGALRIDHAMALWQFFLIPEGERPSAGTHVRYPFSDLVAALSELSRKDCALVVGEDLGFVPKGFRAAMEEARILSYRILLFERDGEAFRDAKDYPELALACLSTHDLPVFRAWWRGEDIEIRRRFGLVGETQSKREAAERGLARSEMLMAFRRAEVLGSDLEEVDADAPFSDALLEAAYRFAARSRALLVGVRLADVAGPFRPTNVPGTIDEYPNWRPRSQTDLANIGEKLEPIARIMREERPGGRRQKNSD